MDRMNAAEAEGFPAGRNFSAREDLLSIAREMKPRPRRVLSVGTGAGETERAIREWCGAYVVGVEIDERLAAIARGKLDHIILGDAEKFEVPKACGEFDLVLCTDILEHLRDPEALLCKLKGAMSPGGLILISVPNVRNWHVLYSLIAKGEWEYRDSGLLDKTHLRFFTRRSLCRMITRAGYKILEVRPKVRVSASTGARCALIKLIGFLLPRDFLTYQFLVTARKSSAVPSETERAEGAQE